MSFVPFCTAFTRRAVSIVFFINSILAITGRDITVWIISALLAIGLGWSRYSRWKTRDRLVREFAAMDPQHREKMLTRLDPKLALEIREQLMERFRILS